MDKSKVSVFGRILVCTALAVLLPLSASQATTLTDLQTGWDNANFQLDAEAQRKAFEQLVAEADIYTATNPADASGWVWSGIIKSSFAGIKGGLGALSLAKQARADFEHSLQLDQAAMNGSAYTSLGTLYAAVPGWPLGFGDDEKAEQMLLQGLAIDPTGLDSNYFCANFLADQGRSVEARKYYETALMAPPRPGREVADAGRRAQVRAELADLDH